MGIGKRLRAMWALGVALAAILAVVTTGTQPGGAQEAPRIVVDADASSAAVEASVSRGVGEMFKVAVLIDGFAGERGLGTAEFKLIYDPVILRAVRIEPSAQVIAGGFDCQELSVVVPGEAYLGCQITPLPADGPEGEQLRLGEVTFEAIATGTSALTLERAEVDQGTGFCIIDVENCELPSSLFVAAAVNVAGVAQPPPPAATPSRSPVVSGAVQVTLELEPADGISKGEEFRIIARATNIPAPGLAGFLVDLRFNEKVLETVSTAPGDDVQGMSCPNLDQDEPGLAQLACVFLPLPAQGPTGDLVLGTITLKANGYGDAQLRSPVVSLGGFDESCYFSTEITGEGCDRPVADIVDVPSVKIRAGDTPWLLVGAVIVSALVIGAGGLALLARRGRAKEVAA